jgi:hypothetical protein
VRRIAVLFASVLVCAAAAVQDVRAGTQAVPGRTVSNVRYALSAKGDVASLRFTLVPAATRVRVRVSPRAAWRPCRADGVQVSCGLGVPVTALRGLEIDA